MNKIKRGRGRPKGNKNQNGIKTEKIIHYDEHGNPRKRGRPKGTIKQINAQNGTIQVISTKKIPLPLPLVNCKNQFWCPSFHEQVPLELCHLRASDRDLDQEWRQQEYNICSKCNNNKKGKE
mgnify:CR=1 FL=1